MCGAAGCCMRLAGWAAVTVSESRLHKSVCMTGALPYQIRLLLNESDSLA